MSKRSLDIKVGLFVALCLALLGGLMLEFSRGANVFRPTYYLHLKSGNVGGLKTEAQVLMSGVQVGNVSSAELGPEGTNVTITLKIYKPLVIHRSARFVIESAGILGDQYVAIYPEGNSGPVLQPGDEAVVQEPFNLQEVARSAAGFIKRMDEAARNVNDAVQQVRRIVLNDETLTNLAITIADFRHVSEDAQTTVHGLDLIVTSNQAPAALAMSNLVAFSERLNTAAVSAQGIVDTNGPDIRAAILNLETSTAMLTNLIAEVENGRGPAGALLKDQQLTANFSIISSNLAVTSSNLNQQGLWRVLWGPKHTEVNPPAPRPSKPGHNPSE